MVEELNRSEQGGKKVFALKLCVFVTVLGYITNTIFGASRTDSVYVDREGSLLACVREQNQWRLDMKYRPLSRLWLWDQQIAARQDLC